MQGVVEYIPTLHPVLYTREYLNGLNDCGGDMWLRIKDCNSISLLLHSAFGNTRPVTQP